MIMLFFFFFFSSRRRHTRFDCDWSSDVCSSDLVDDGRAMVTELLGLPDLVARPLQVESQIRGLAQRYAEARNALYLGRGVNFPVALEGALKLKEISYIHAEGYPAAEMKHGPIALIDENMPVVCLAPKDSVYAKVVSNMQEVK